MDPTSVIPTSSHQAPPTADFHEPLDMHYDEEFPSLAPNPSGQSSSGPTSGLSSPGASSKWSQKMRIGSNIVTSVFHIPFEERSDKNNRDFGESDASRDCMDITKRTGAHIEMSNSSRDQSLTFLITGKQKSVLEAKAEILKHFQTQATGQVAIPKEHHRFILGRQGLTLSKLEKDTSTKITVPRPNDDSTTILVQGTREGIEKAVHEIQLISDEQSKQASERLTIPKKYHPFIYGPHNEKVNRLMEETGVRINIPPHSVNHDDIFIVGEKEGVAKSVGIIKREFEDWKRYATVSVEVGKAQHKYIIGPKRNTIHEILAKTGVSVEMPPGESPSETITLRGPTEKLGGALTLVYDKANSVVTRSVEAPSWIHKYVIGKKGANIRNITMNYPRVHVEIKDNENVIVVEGPPEEVDPVCVDLTNCVQELVDKMYFKDFNIDPKYHKHIIGKNGANVNRLKDETGVIISVKDGNSAVIHLEGSRQGVELAYSKLMEQVEKLDGEKEKDLIIDHKFHGNIIGARGEKIREIRDQFNNVQITFPAVGEKRDVVTVRGPKEDVDRCCRHMMAVFKELQDNSFQIKVPVFPQCYRLVVGKGGMNIKKIREETKTRFELPPLDEGKSRTEAEIIVITGKRENCEAARDRLLSIQSSVANVIESQVMIPAKFHNQLIGSGGRFVQSISEECGGVAIKFPEPRSKSDRVTLIGPKEDVEKARGILLEHSREREECSYEEMIDARPSVHKFLIGKNGANIRKIREATGARVLFPTDGGQITIIGKKEGVLKAKAQLEGMLKDLHNVVEGEMNVDPAFHRHFVLRRGEILHRIAEEFGGVQISFPKAGTNSTRVTLKGAAECVEEAKKRISSIVDELSRRVSIEVVIDQIHHRTIMGARGSKVQQIQSDWNVDIKFPDRYNDGPEGEGVKENGDGINHSAIIRVSGLPENCEGAKAALLDQVPIQLTVDIPFEMHRFIIGEKGKNVRELMNAHNVSITVPQADVHSNTITISGSPKNAATAQTALLARKDEINEEKKLKELKSFEIKIEVDPEFHPKIIGRKGASISRIRDKYDVNIQLPKRGDENENIITIIGFEDKAKAARDEIMGVVGAITEMSKFKEEVEIDNRVHSRIIGSRGRNVRGIMDDYGVDIRFPRANEPNPNLVVISGAIEDKVLDAKDHLLNLEEEFLQDVSENEYLQQFVRDGKGGKGDMAKGKGGMQSNGFVVKGAPWEAPPDTQSNEEFPSFGNGGMVASEAEAPPPPVARLSSAWGARKHF